MLFGTVPLSAHPKSHSIICSRIFIGRHYALRNDEGLLRVDPTLITFVRVCSGAGVALRYAVAWYWIGDDVISVLRGVQ